MKKEIKEYIVRVGYRNFHFPNGRTALNFAVDAATALEEEEGAYNNDVTIEVITRELPEVEE